jgi:hypothetical protein
VKFEILGGIEQVATIASGPSLRIRAFLRKAHGGSRWRKMKGVALVRLRNGQVRRVELHWYEAHGVGRRDIRIKRYVD